MMFISKEHLPPLYIPEVPTCGVSPSINAMLANARIEFYERLLAGVELIDDEYYVAVRETIRRII